ncbi:hypothetical protein JOB18_033118 [Solea senegalensis]|uniref:Uncharacterized protein n=1 Tax=Solea senegalensis TaxID=28829 RepID=A0AAV6QUT2_SOLSE|nr:hypothetical protein JOB18_033118 [Solea senegalensis]
MRTKGFSCGGFGTQSSHDALGCDDTAASTGLPTDTSVTSQPPQKHTCGIPPLWSDLPPPPAVFTLGAKLRLTVFCPVFVGSHGGHLWRGLRFREQKQRVWPVWASEGRGGRGGGDPPPPPPPNTHPPHRAVLHPALGGQRAGYHHHHQWKSRGAETLCPQWDVNQELQLLQFTCHHARQTRGRRADLYSSAVAQKSPVFFNVFNYSCIKTRAELELARAAVSQTMGS